LKNVNHLKQERGAIVAEMRLLLDDNTAFEAASKKVDAIDAEIRNYERMEALESGAAAVVPRDSMAGQMGSYSIRAAVAGAAEGRLTGLEGEVSAELAKGAPQTRGVRIPLAAIMGNLEQRDQTSVTAGATVNQKFGSLINRLKPASKVIGMGATVIQSTGYAPLVLPRHLTGQTPTWLSEGQSLTTSDSTWDQLTLAPLTVGSEAVLSRTLLKTNSLGVDSIIAGDLNYTLSEALDAAALGGNGTGNTPTGIWTSVAVTPAETLLSDTASDLIKAIDLADNGTGAFLLTTLAASAARKVKDTLNRPIAIEDQLHDYNFDVTNQFPTVEAITYGVWSDLVVAMWGGVDLVVNPYAKSSSGALVLDAFLDANVGTRHGSKSFAWSALTQTS